MLENFTTKSDPPQHSISDDPRRSDRRERKNYLRKESAPELRNYLRRAGASSLIGLDRGVDYL